MSLSSASLPSLEESKGQYYSSGNAVSFRGSNETEYLPSFYKSVQTLNPSSSCTSNVLPARSFSKLKLNKKATKDLWKKITVTRHLSWGRKPGSRPWISIAGRNERKPFIKQRPPHRSESSDEDDRLTNMDKDGKEDNKLVSITVECPSNQNIFDEDESEISSKIQKNELTEGAKGRSSIDSVIQKPKFSNMKENSPKVMRDGSSMVKQQSLDEGKIHAVRPKIKSVYQSLPVLELLQPKKRTSQDSCSQTDKSVRWRSDTIQQRGENGNGFKISKSASSDNNPALVKPLLKGSKLDNSSNSMDSTDRSRGSSSANTHSYPNGSDRPPDRSPEPKLLEKKPSLKRQDSTRVLPRMKQSSKRSESIVTFKDSDEF